MLEIDRRGTLVDGRPTSKLTIRKARHTDIRAIASMVKRFITEHPVYRQYHHYDPNKTGQLVTAAILAQDANDRKAVDDPVYRRILETAIREREANHEEQYALVLVAEKGAQLVGFLAVFVLEEAYSTRLYVDETGWWVEPEHRNGTVGPKMLRSLLYWAQQKRELRFVRMIAPKGSRLAKYYEKLGFMEVDTTYVLKLKREG